MAIKLEMLRVFRVVAEQGSLSRAAEALARTPSAVSMMLTQFEADVGAPLFETERKNRLSKLGELILEEAVRATDTFHGSTEAIRRLTGSIAGIVRVAVVPSVTVTLLPRAIATYREIRPEVRLEISDVDSAAVRRRVRLDEADIGILTASGHDDGSGVTIMRDRLGIIFRAGGRIDATLRGGGTPGWNLLRQEPLIANPLCVLVDHPLTAEMLEHSSLEARNTTALLSFIDEGLGATVLPESIMRKFTGELRFVAPNDPAVTRDLRMIHSSRRRLSPAAQALWDFFATAQSRELPASNS